MSLWRWDWSHQLKCWTVGGLDFSVCRGSTYQVSSVNRIWSFFIIKWFFQIIRSHLFSVFVYTTVIVENSHTKGCKRLIITQQTLRMKTDYESIWCLTKPTQTQSVSQRILHMKWEKSWVDLNTGSDSAPADPPHTGVWRKTLGQDITRLTYITNQHIQFTLTGVNSCVGHLFSTENSCEHWHHHIIVQEWSNSTVWTGQDEEPVSSTKTNSCQRTCDMFTWDTQV